MCANGFSHTNFASTLSDGHQHDIHDANAAYYKRYGAHRKQNDTDRQRDIAGRFENRGEVLDIVESTRAVPVSKKLFDLPSDDRHILRTRRLSVQNLDAVRAGIASQQIEWNNHGFARNLGLAERCDPLFDHTDDGES